MKSLVFSLLLVFTVVLSVAGQTAYTREKEWEREIAAFIEIDQA